MQRIVREWTGLIFGGRQTGFVFNAEALRTQRKRREKQKQGRLTVAARIASLVCSAAAEVDRCGSISCRLRSSLPRSLSAPRSGLSPCGRPQAGLSNPGGVRPLSIDIGGLPPISNLVAWRRGVLESTCSYATLFHLGVRGRNRTLHRGCAADFAEGARPVCRHGTCGSGGGRSRASGRIGLLLDSGDASSGVAVVARSEFSRDEAARTIHETRVFNRP